MSMIRFKCLTIALLDDIHPRFVRLKTNQCDPISRQLNGICHDSPVFVLSFRVVALEIRGTSLVRVGHWTVELDAFVAR